MIRRSIRCRLLPGGVFLMFLAHAAIAGAADGFRWKDDEAAGTSDLLLGDRPVLRYMAAFDRSTPAKIEETYKVYHHVFGPDGGPIITKGPGGQYTHHRGLYVGWNKTSGADGAWDFWHCSKGVHLRHGKFLEKAGDANRGTMTAEIDWNDADGKAVIKERRKVTVVEMPKSAAPNGGWQIDWQTTLTSQRGELKLEGDRQHAGFQFRAAQEVSDKNSARYLRPAGFPQQPEAVQVGDAGDPPPHSDIPWVAMTYEVQGKRYTVEYFEDPSLPKPSLFSERPYGRFGAFFKTTLTPERPLTMRYRVNVTAGEPPTAAAVQKRFDDFVAGLKNP